MRVLRYCDRCPLRSDPLADVRGRVCVGNGQRCPRAPKAFEMKPKAGRLVHLVGSPVLRQRAQEVTEAQAEGPGVADLVDALFATMRMHHGIGLAAPQIGVGLRVAVVEVDGVALTLINPEISSRSHEQSREEEGCLSIPGTWGEVERPVTIGVRAMYVEEPFGANGLLARAIQHEIDHLDGVLFTDHVQTVRKSPVPEAVTAVRINGRLMCPGCGWIYEAPSTDVDVVCCAVHNGCHSPILRVKGPGPWTKKLLALASNLWP